MVSTGKRYRYVSDEASSSDIESNDGIYNPQTRKQGSLDNTAVNADRLSTVLMNYNTQIGRKQKCFSKNALQARENRLKKKIYVSKLESEVAKLRHKNKQLNTVVESQSILITDMRKNIKYLKSVLANSSDIGKLIRNIHQSTGMSVTTSLDSKLSLKNYVSKQKVPIARKTAHPWEEQDPHDQTGKAEECMQSFPFSMCNDVSNDLSNVLMGSGTFEDFCFDIPELVETPVLNNGISNQATSSVPSEHNYTCVNKGNSSESDEQEDAGVCLHVSKHRVSLEFCSGCSDNASENWID